MMNGIMIPEPAEARGPQRSEASRGQRPAEVRGPQRSETRRGQRPAEAEAVRQAMNDTSHPCKSIHEAFTQACTDIDDSLMFSNEVLPSEGGIRGDVEGRHATWSSE